MGILAKISEDVEEKQLKELTAVDLSDDLKRMIAVEYKRLCRRHPGWRKHRAMRKAGEKYGIQFNITDAAEDSKRNSA